MAQNHLINLVFLGFFAVITLIVTTSKMGLSAFVEKIAG